MGVSKEEMKAEAIKRMKAMKIFSDTIKMFEKDGTILASEPPLGAYYSLTEQEKELIKEFEKKTNALVYTVIRGGNGPFTNFLFVSKYKDDWDVDWNCLKSGIAYAYVYNHEAPDCSESGSIYIMQSPGGGLLRKG